MRRFTLSLIAALAAFLSLAVLAVVSLMSGMKADFAFGSQSALWLGVWAFVCLLAVAAWALSARLGAVREEGARYREMVQEVNSIITRISADGTILFMNRFALEFFGWEESEIVGQNVYGTLIPERDSTGRDMSGVWKDICERDARQTTVNENKRKDGSRVWVSWTNRWVQGDRPWERVVLSVGNDLTAQHRNRAQLQLLEEAVESARDGVAITNLDGAVLYCNPAWAKAYGYRDPDQAQGLRVNLFDCSDDSGSDSSQILNEQLHAEGRAAGEVRSGDRTCLVSASRVNDPDGVPTAFVGVTRDVSEDRSKAVELQRAKERAEAAGRTKSMILSNITHEFRTPLNGVFGMLQILLMTDLDEKQTEYVNTAMESARDLGGIIDAILTYSEVDSTAAEDMLVQPFSLLNTVLGVIETHWDSAAGKGLALELRAAPGTVDTLEGDGGRIRRICEILLGNAVKFTTKGSITMELSTSVTDGVGGLELEIMIRDTGIGIAENRLSIILNGFEQGDQTYSRRFGGLGLGLCMARRLAESIQGELSVRSEEGRGTEAILTVRVAALSEERGGMVPELAPRVAGGRMPRVLLALGHDLDGVALKYFLECRGVDVDIAPEPGLGFDLLAEQAEQAEQAERDGWDLAVFNAGRADGGAVLSGLREVKVADVPVVLLGGEPQEVCDMAPVVHCASYPVDHAQFWELFLTTVSTG